MGLFDQPDEIPVSDPDDKNRLFETLEETTESSQNYLKLFSIVAVCVVIAGAIIYYLMKPGVGDLVRAPAGLEDAVRSHFLDKEKRTATDISFYNCDGFYWARVDVEERPDIQANPIYKIPRYRAKAVQSDGTWNIAAAPVTSDEMDVPCKF